MQKLKENAVPIQSNCPPTLNFRFPSTTGKSNSSRGLLLGQRGEAEVRLDDAEVGEEGLGLLVGDGRVDNNIISLISS